MSFRNDKAFLEAHLQASRDLLERYGDNPIHVFDRISIESRIEELEASLEQLTARLPKLAEVALFFYGEPVVEQSGIDARFSGEALKTFQDLVSKQLATRLGPIGASGPIRQESGSRLHITNVVRGSFGFTLEELADSKPLFGETQLATAVRDVTGLMRAAQDTDDTFADAVDNVNARVYDALCGFLTVVQKGGATFKLSAPDEEIEFDSKTLAAAVERTEAERVEQDDVPFAGIFLGALLESRTFEFRLDSDELIRGKIDQSVEPRALLAQVDQRCAARMRVVTLKRPGKELRRFTLIALDAP